MKRTLIALFAVTSVVLTGLVVLQKTADAGQARQDTATEQWVNANHLRVKVDGKWQDIRMMPLADHLCDSGNRLFKRYCE